MAVTTTKSCRQCLLAKDLVEFHKDPKRSDGLHVWCKACKRAYDRERYLDRTNLDSKYNRNNHLRQKYGISEEQYDEMFLRQEGRCAICKLESEHTLHVDHDHKTFKVRGLLCSSCNPALGGFQDNINVLNSAITYLSTHE